MNKQCIEDIKRSNSLGEILEIFQKYYELNEPFKPLTGNFVKSKLIENLGEVVNKLDVKEKGQSTIRTGLRKYF